MPKSRKKRLAEQRKLQATLEQTQNRLNKAEHSAAYYQDKAFAAERRSAVAMQVPSGLVQDILAKAVCETIKNLVIEMREPVIDIRGRIEREAAQIKEGMLVRGTDNAALNTYERFDTGDMQVSFDFPGFKWTQIIDREMLRSMKGGQRGPAFMQDRPLYYADVPEVPAYADMDEASAMSEIPYKVF